MDLRGIRTEIGTLLRADLSTLGWTVYDFVPEAPATPALAVGIPDGVTYNVNLKSHSRITLAVHVLAGQLDADATQARLDGALSRGAAGSVVDILDGAKNGAWVGGLRLLSAGNTRATTVGNQTVLVADVAIEVPLA